MITATRYHDISAGHKVTGHKNKCAHLHGHNFRIHFTVTADELDALGMVMDFGVIKSKLCKWLEDHWDHKFLIFKDDDLLPALEQIAAADLVICPFNPTAENMAKHLCEVVGPEQLVGTECTLIKCVIEETRKCSATYEVTHFGG